MTIEEAKKYRDTLESNRRQKMFELEIIEDSIAHADRRIKAMCPHEHVTGKIIKWCHDCGHADLFWAFGKVGGKNNARK